MNGLLGSAAAALHDADLDARAVEGVGGREVRADDLARQVRLGAALLEVAVDRVDPLVPRQLADEAGRQLGPHERARGRRGGLLVEPAESLQERGRHLGDLGGTSLRLQLRELVDVFRAGAFLRPLAERTLGLDEPDRDGHALVVGEAVQVAGERGVKRSERVAPLGAVLVEERLDVDGPSVGTRRPEVEAILALDLLDRCSGREGREVGLGLVHDVARGRRRRGRQHGQSRHDGEDGCPAIHWNAPDRIGGRRGGGSAPWR